MLERKYLAPLAVASGLLLGLGMGAEAGADTIAYWRFEPDDPNTIPNEFLADAAGNYALTNHNGVAESSDTATGFNASTGSASFDGSNDGLSTTSTFDLTGVTAVTIEWFMKPNAGETQGVVVEHTENYNTVDAAFIAWTRNEGELLGSQLTDEGYYKDEAHGVVTSDWTHYAMIIDGSSTGEDHIKLFVDYEQVTPDVVLNENIAPAFLNDTLYIGSRDGGAALQYAGLLDEVRISDEALAPDAFLGYVPEPASLGMMGVGCALLLGRRR